MAEKATSGDTMAIELTYRDNPDATPPDGAMAFNYQHVRDLMKRLREEYFRQYGARGEIRFIVAGERGTQKGRVHWHMIIFADRPFKHFGKWTKFDGQPLDGPRITPFGRSNAYMNQWSMWPHGHNVVKEANAETMAYVVIYACKDQFNVVKSKGTMREHKSENSGASYFRMSKHPPIGIRFLERVCDDWEERRIVPPTLQIRVPDLKSYWWPKGQLREFVLRRIWEINEKRKEETGHDCPQWNTLLSSLVDVNENRDWETLVYGPDTEQEEEDFSFDAWKHELERHQLKRQEAHRATELRNRCGGIRVCRLCWRGKSQEAKDAWRKWEEYQKAAYLRDDERPLGIDFDQWYREKGEINPHCIPSQIGDP